MRETTPTMATFSGFCSKPRSCVVVALFVIFTASFYLTSKRIMKSKPVESQRELVVPESITLLSPEKNPEPHRKWLFEMDNDSMHLQDDQDNRALQVDDPSNFHFDPSTDTLVAIHIQKTGGSNFVRHLVTVQRNGQYLCTLKQEAVIEIEKNKHQRLKGLKGLNRNEVSCPRDPKRPAGGQWLISEKNLGWICGVHATLMEFEDCLPKLDIIDNYYFIVTLRHPVLRYISEYLHFQRNATWSYRRYCGGKEVTLDEMPTCFPGYLEKKPWLDLNLDKFLSCESNWANNRQAMSLADLKLVGCYDKTLYTREERERLILKSAKDNLRQMPFFGMTEYMAESRTLFEKTFDVKFAVDLQQKEVSELHSAPLLQELWNNTTLFGRVLSINRLDLELYNYALELFTERARKIGIHIDKEKVNRQISEMTPEAIDKILKKHHKLNYNLPST